jgi:hypothetical protein
MCSDLNAQSPSPTKYTLDSIFNLKSARSTKFGFGREELKLGGIFKNSVTPGPATYSIPSLIKEHTEITLKPRIKEQSACNLSNPGPGACTSSSITQTIFRSSLTKKAYMLCRRSETHQCHH